MVDSLRIHKKDLLFLLVVFGSAFVGAKELINLAYIYFAGNATTYAPIIKFYLSNALIFFIIAWHLVIYQRRSCLFSLVWVTAYTYSSEIFFAFKHNYIWYIQLLIFLFCIVIVVSSFIIEVSKFKAKLFNYFLCSFWLIILILQTIVFVYYLFHQHDYHLGLNMYNMAWVLLILVTFAETIPQLSAFSKITPIMGLLACILLIIYSFLPSGGPVLIEEPITKFLYYAPIFIMAITAFLYSCWMHYHTIPNERIGHDIGLGVIVVAVFLGVFAVYGYIIAEENDIGIRKGYAIGDYQDIFLYSKYNWLEITGEEFDGWISTNELKCDVVELNDGCMPVLFIYNDTASEADGHTRIVFYNEEQHKAYQVWGNENCMYVRGYVPCDSEHEYPLIFCDGGRMGVKREVIFEVRNQKLIPIGEMIEIEPFDSETATTNSSEIDHYYWNGEEIDIAQYQQNRASIINGYHRIKWLDYRDCFSRIIK